MPPFPLVVVRFYERIGSLLPVSCRRKVLVQVADGSGRVVVGGGGGGGGGREEGQ